MGTQRHAIDNQNNWPGVHWGKCSGCCPLGDGGEASGEEVVTIRLDVRLVTLFSRRNLKIDFQKGDFSILLSVCTNYLACPVAKCLHSLEFPTLASLESGAPALP